MKTTHHTDYLTRYTLLQRIQLPHDETAWNDFMNQYRRYIYSIIHRMKIRPSDADDVYQKVVVKLWKKLPEMDLHKMDYFRGYLAAVVRNTVNDYYRKLQREGGKLHVLHPQRQVQRSQWHRNGNQRYVSLGK